MIIVSIISIGTKGFFYGEWTMDNKTYNDPELLNMFGIWYGNFLKTFSIYIVQFIICIGLVFHYLD